MIPPCKLFFQVFGHRQIKQLIKKVSIQEWGHHVPLKPLKLVLRKILKKIEFWAKHTRKYHMQSWMGDSGGSLQEENAM